MDIPCPKCGEPWDNDEFHYHADESGSDYATVSKNFRANGCAALGTNCSPINETRAAAAGAMYELMGDDLDGVASMMEDAEALGIF